MYKNALCSNRQESFRKAWECLPRIALVVMKAEATDKKEPTFMAELVSFGMG
jgi:hypothetical protein